MLCIHARYDLYYEGAGRLQEVTSGYDPRDTHLHVLQEQVEAHALLN